VVGVVRQCWGCYQHLDCSQTDFRSLKVVGQKTNNGEGAKLNRGLKWEKKFKGKQVVGQKTNKTAKE